MLVFIYIVFGAYASFYIMFWFYLFVYDILPLSNMYVCHVLYEFFTN